MRMRSSLAVLAVMGILLSSVALPAEDAPGGAAYKKLKEGDSLARADRAEEAVAAYREAAGLYENALAEDPDNGAFQTNLRYCVGKTGYVPLIAAQKLEKAGDPVQAAVQYELAIAAYEAALKRFPDEKNFLQNLEFARQHRAVVGFSAALISGDPAPGFDLERIGGGRLSLGELKGKVVVLEFVTGWCPSCQKSMEMLKRLHGVFDAEDVRIVVVSLDKVDGWSRRNGHLDTAKNAEALPFPFLWATPGTIRDYGDFNSVPTLLLIDREGRLKHRVASDRRNFETVKALIDRLR